MGELCRFDIRKDWQLEIRGGPWPRGTHDPSRSPTVACKHLDGIPCSFATTEYREVLHGRIIQEPYATDMA